MIANEIIHQFAQREGLALNESEIESIRQAQDETYQIMEKALKTGSEDEKQYAELAIKKLQEMADIYGVTLEEYQAVCVDSLVLSEERARLAEKKFHGDSDALMEYIQNSYDEFSVSIQ